MTIYVKKTTIKSITFGSIDLSNPHIISVPVNNRLVSALVHTSSDKTKIPVEVTLVNECMIICTTMISAHIHLMSLFSAAMSVPKNWSVCFQFPNQNDCLITERNLRVNSG